MSDEIEDRSLLKDDGDLFLELGNLLKKNRPKIVNDQIKIIVNDNTISIEDKIIKIKELDEKIHINSNLYLLKKNSLKNKLIDRETLNSESFDEETKHELSKRGFFLNKTVRDQRKTLRNNLRKSSYINFLFRELPRISSFSKKTGVLEYSIFLPSVKISRNMEHFFTKNIRQCAADILKSLTYIEERGWVVLSKYEYNLTVEFKLLCTKILEIAGESIRSSDKHFFTKIRRLEGQFYTCIFNKSHTELLKKSISKILESSKEHNNSTIAVINSVDYILNPSKNGPSLYDLLLGVNIVELNRMISFDDLINKKVKALISNFDYNASLEVKQQIKSTIDSNIAALNHLTKQKADIRKVKGFLSIDSENRVTTDHLDRFFRVSKLRKTFEEAAPPNDIMEFIENFLTEFLRSFTDFFIGEIQLEDKGMISVFEPLFFQEKIIELEHITDKFKRLRKVLDHMYIDRARLSKILNSNISLDINKSKGELDLIVEIKRVSEFLFKLGITLSEMYLNRDQYTTSTLPVTIISSQKGPCIIPYVNDRVITNDILNSETIDSVFQIIIGILFTAAHYLENQKIIGLLNNEAYINEELAKTSVILERLATPLEYDVIKETYNL